MRAGLIFCGIAAVLINCISIYAAGVDLTKLPSASAAPVVFETDVKPLLERSCLPCHGPERAKAHFRVDSRETLLKGGESHQGAVVPGNSAASPLILNAAGLVREMEMPPLDNRDKYPALSTGEIGVVRAWIDQGAGWPANITLQRAVSRPANQEVAGTSVEQLGVDPLFDDIRRGDRKAIAERLRGPACLDLRDEAGNTPLIQAAFYLDAQTVRMLLDAGAQLNARNGAGMTALMKAVSDPDKTRLLLERGADVNAVSRDKNTALITACYAYGEGSVVAALLAHGADVRAKNHAGANAVRAAAEAGDVEVLRQLLDHGGDPNSSGLSAESSLPITALMVAAQLGHLDCVKLLLARGAELNRNTGHGNALAFAVFTERRDVARWLLDHGVEVNTSGRRLESFRMDTGFTPLMYAALNEHNDSTLVEWLLARGAKVDAKSSTGDTALGLARLRGDTRIVAALKQAGAQESAPAEREPFTPFWDAQHLAKRDPGVLRKAAEAGVSLLLQSSVHLSEATGNRCFTCHQHAQPTLAWTLARQKGIAYPKELAAAMIDDELRVSRRRADNAIQEPLPVPNISGWFLVGLDAAGYRADRLTDEFVYCLSRYQYGDGRWISRTARAPSDYTDVTSTAIALRALRAYAPPTMKAQFAQRIAKGARWLRSYEPRTTEERALQLLGLIWAGEPTAKLAHRANALLDEQHGDGGWAQLPTLESDAYATGLALYTLHEAGLKVSQGFYQRGIDFLLKNQCRDGSWAVQTRASPVQVAIDNIFPHGKDQWISSDATSWSSMALMLACEHGLVDKDQPATDLLATRKSGK